MNDSLPERQRGGSMLQPSGRTSRSRNPGVIISSPGIEGIGDSRTFKILQPTSPGSYLKWRGTELMSIASFKRNSRKKFNGASSLGDNLIFETYLVHFGKKKYSTG